MSSSKDLKIGDVALKIQLLHFPDCPNAELARAALREALAGGRFTAQIEELDISRDDVAPALRSWGSPTILVDGVDVRGESPRDGALSCRLYKDGVPSAAEIRARQESGGSSGG